MLVQQCTFYSIQHNHDEQAELFDEHFTDDDFQTTGRFHTTLTILY